MGKHGCGVLVNKNNKFIGPNNNRVDLTKFVGNKEIHIIHNDDKKCNICDDTGKFTNCFDQEIVCSCIDEKNKNMKKQKRQEIDLELKKLFKHTNDKILREFIFNKVKVLDRKSIEKVYKFIYTKFIK